MARRQAAGTYRRIAALFTSAFIVALVVLALLGHFGLPESLIGAILGAGILATVAAVGINAGTLDISEFYLAGRSVSGAANGMASAAAVMGGGIYLGLAGALLADPWTGAAITAGWSLGCLLMAVGVAPYFRKSAAFGIADFLGIRFDSGAVRIAAVVTTLLALFAALAAALAAAAFAGALLFGIPEGVALTIAVVMVLATTVLGGMRALTLTAIVQYIVLAIAFLLPPAVASYAEFSIPIPQLTFGYALDQAGFLAGLRADALAEALTGVFLPLQAGGAAGYLAIVLSVAMGAAALPHLVIRTATVPSVDQARRTAGWTLFFLLVVAMTAPTYAAFAELTILRDLRGTGLEILPDWVYRWSDAGFLTVCDGYVADGIAAIEACRNTPGFTGNLAASELAIGKDLLVFAAPEIFDLPYVGSALIAAGALTACVAAAGAIAFTMASAVGNDFYGGVINPRASAGRQMIVTRVLLIVTVAAGTAAAAWRPDDAYGFALAALGLSAGGLFPAMLIAVWWKRANAAGAIAAIGTGTLVTALIALEYRYPGTLQLGAFNPSPLGLTELTAALVGAPAGLAAGVLASLATAPPTADDNALVDAIRRPGGTPFVQEIESR